MATYQPPTEILPKFNEFVFNQANEPEYLDMLVVHKAGTETITGNKTITGTFTANNATTSLTASGDNNIITTGGTNYLTASGASTNNRIQNSGGTNYITASGFGSNYISTSFANNEIVSNSGSNTITTNTGDNVITSTAGDVNIIAGTQIDMSSGNLVVSNNNTTITATGTATDGIIDLIATDPLITGLYGQVRAQAATKIELSAGGTGLLSIFPNYTYNKTNQFQIDDTSLVNHLDITTTTTTLNNTNTNIQSGATNKITISGSNTTLNNAFNSITSTDATGSGYQIDLKSTGAGSSNRIQAVFYNVMFANQNDFQTTGASATAVNRILSALGRNIITSGRTTATANLIEATAAGINEIISASGSLGANTITATSGTGTNIIQATTAGGGNKISATTGTNTIVATTGRNTLTTAGTNATANLIDATGAGGGNTIRATNATGTNTISATGGGSNTITTTTGTNTMSATAALGNNTISATTGTNTISATTGTNLMTTSSTGQNKMENTGLGTNLITTANTAAGSNTISATAAGGGNILSTTTGQNLIRNTGAGSNVINTAGGTNTITSTSALATANVIEAGVSALPGPSNAGGNTIRTLGTGVNLITGNGGTTIEAKGGSAVYINANSSADTAVRLEASAGGITLDTINGVNISSTNAGIKINTNPLGSIQYRFYSSTTPGAYGAPVAGNNVMRFANSYTTATAYNLEYVGAFLSTGTAGFNLPFAVIPFAIQVFCDTGLITGGAAPYYAQFRVCGAATTTNYGEYGTIQGTGSLLGAVAQTYTTAILTSTAVIPANTAFYLVQKMTGATQPTGITNKHCEAIVFFQQV